MAIYFINSISILCQTLPFVRFHGILSTFRHNNKGKPGFSHFLVVFSSVPLHRQIMHVTRHCSVFTNVYVVLPWYYAQYRHLCTWTKYCMYQDFNMTLQEQNKKLDWYGIIKL